MRLVRTVFWVVFFVVSTAIVLPIAFVLEARERRRYG